MLGFAGRTNTVSMRAAPALLLAFSAWTSPARAQPIAFPTLASRVTDNANIVPADVEARLTVKLAKLETEVGPQLVVVTVPSLQGQEIADYGLQLGNHWGIGSKERNDGLLLLVAPKERKLRIEVGMGLTSVVTDPEAAAIIDQTIVPRFKLGDMPGGIEAGVDALIREVSVRPAAATQPSAAPSQSIPATAPEPATASAPNFLLYGGLAGGMAVLALLFWFVRARDGA